MSMTHVLIIFERNSHGCPIRYSVEGITAVSIQFNLFGDNIHIHAVNSFSK